MISDASCVRHRLHIRRFGWDQPLRCRVLRAHVPASIAQAVSDATIFHSIRTDPLHCGGELTQPLVPSASSSCATQLMQAPGVWVDIKVRCLARAQSRAAHIVQSALDAVPLTVAPSFDPNGAIRMHPRKHLQLRADGEIYLTRIVVQTTDGTREHLYSKMLIVSGASDQLVIRWSNLYDQTRWHGSESYCSVSAASPVSAYQWWDTCDADVLSSPDANDEVAAVMRAHPFT